MSPKEHILSIRKNYTGEDSDINAAGENVVSHLTEMLTIAIKELARNIYQKDSHFVMELIQNADDNEYNLKVEPFLKIVLDKKKVIVENNERGFSKKNVEAICKIGKSTKSLVNGNKGYIGEKGIGFKSVFRISNQPHIYSNGYRFKFKTSDNEKSNAIELGYILPEWLDDLENNINKDLTTIILPYRKRMSREEKEKIKDVHPTLLLFLNKLARFEVEDREENKKFLFRKEKRRQTVRLYQESHIGAECSSTVDDYFLIERKGILVPKHARVDQRSEATETKIILSFPLNQNGELNFKDEQYVYAFLPVYKYGFRFLIQADFILTSGRESIDEDSPWNIWIREELLKTYKIAVDTFKANKKFKYSFLEYLPYHNETFSDYFKPLVEEIIEYCQNAPVVLSQSERWMKPTHTIIGDLPTFALFENKFIKRALGSEYLHPNISFSKALIETLKVRLFKEEQLLMCLQKELIQKRDDFWYINLFAYLSQFADRTSFITKLRDMQIIPTDNLKGTQILVASTSQSIFLPLDIRTTYSFESTIQVISKSLFRLITVSKNKRLKREILNFLDVLNIKKPSPYTIVQHYIIRRYSTDEWKNGKDQIDHLRYIRDHWSQLKANQDQIISWCKDKPLIHTSRTAETRYFSKPHDVYISKIYGNSSDTENLLSGIANVSFINEAYIRNNGNNKENRTEWFKFLKQLGCLILPRVEDLAKVLDLNIAEKNRQVLRFIDTHWNTYRKETTKNGIKQLWFKTLSEGKSIYSNGNLYSATEVFIRNKNTERIFGSDVIYYPDKLNPDLAEKLGFHSSVDGKSLVQYLLNLSSKNSILSKRRATMIYSQLSHDLSVNVAEAFSRSKLLYLDSAQSWFGKNEVFWVNASNIFGKKYGYCELNFPNDLKSFFVSRVRIEEKPTPKILVEFLEEVIKHFEKNASNEAKLIINRLLAELSSRAAEVDLDHLLLQKINQQVLIHNGEVWKHEHDIFYNDNDALFQLFKDEPSIGFIDVLKEYLPKTTFLLRHLGIRSVSKEVNATGLNLNLAIINDKLTNKVRKYAKVLEDMMYTQYYPDFDVLKQNGVFEKLKDFKIYEIPELQLEYSLNTIIRTGVSSSFLEGNSIYLNRDAENLLYSLALELANFLDQPLLLEFLIIMLSSEEATVLQILKAKNIIAPPLESAIDLGSPVNGASGNETTAENTNENDEDRIEFEEEEYDNGDDDEDLEEEADTPNNPILQKPLSFWKPSISIEKAEAKRESYKGHSASTDGSEEGKEYRKSEFVKKKANGGHSPSISQRDRDAIGDYGEKLVYTVFKKKLSLEYSHCQLVEVQKFGIFQALFEGTVIAELKLLNDKNRVQGGYDMTISKSGQTSYYEIKTTVRNDNPLFCISEEQWRFIKLKGKAYTVIRVVNAGERQPLLIEINDPYKLWKEEKLSGFPVNIQL